MKILILNQAFYPDPTSVGQHARDLAIALAASGHQVTVLASSRNYEDPQLRFPKREQWEGVTIVRVPGPGLGKKAKWRRLVDSASFFLAAALKLAFLSPFDVVVTMTMPPLIGVLGALFVRLKGGRMVLWLMDLHPDAAIAAGWLKDTSLAARGLKRAARFTFEQAGTVITMDRFMTERICAQGVPPEKIESIPPWSHDHALTPDPKAVQAFRERAGLSGKFVVMYSGNHSPCHPLDTLLEAARRLAGNERIVFCFIGGGTELPKVRRFAATQGLSNIACLPYQPLEALATSLSAADLHVVVLGQPFVGIAHPCKIYNVLALGIPFLYIGPSPSHVSDLIPDEPRQRWAFAARHGDVDAVINHIQAAGGGQLERHSAAELAAASRFSAQLLLPRMTRAIVSGASQASAGHGL